MRTTIARLGMRAAVVAAVVSGAAVAAVAPAEAATNHWGAIAVGPQSAHTAWTYDYPSAPAAASSAVSRCGARDCQAVVEVANGCAALAQASNGALGWAGAGSLAAAGKSALAHAEGAHARIVTWVCTTGHG